jgi:methyltransferase (TIGR00027 family)
MQEPDSTAVRVALWRAMHVQLDPPPHVLEDELGLRLVDPPDGWRDRPDMDPQGTRGFRAWIVARTRFVEDLLEERNIAQYVMLGAGLDTFAQRRPDLATRLRTFEVDQPGTQAWKRQRLADLGLPTPASLRFVPVNFEDNWSLLESLSKEGFNSDERALVASMGVSMYLTRDANLASLRQITALSRGSTLVMTFQLPLDLLEPEDRPLRQMVEAGARGSETPFISFFSPEEMLALAGEAGFAEAQHVSGAELNERYFAGRPDGLRAPSGEDLLVATT